MGNGINTAESNGSDTDHYIQRLVVTNPLREPVLRLAIQALQLPVGSRGLDAGSGLHNNCCRGIPCWRPG